MDFSNREIAGYVWFALFIVAVAFNHSVRQAFVGVLRAFCQPLILCSLAIASAYIAAWVLALWHFGVWTTDNLKATVLWAVSFAFATMFDINRVSEDRTFFKKAVCEAFAITGVLTFMVEFYSFSLPVELIAVPLLTLLTMIHATSYRPEHRQVERIAGNLLSAIGLSYLAYSLYRTIIDMTAFATLENAREFGLPILLTLCFLPFLYALVIYTVYERSVVGLTWAIPDPTLRQWVKWRAILSFRLKLDLLQRWVGSIQRFNPTDRDALRRSFQEIHRLAERETNPPPVAAESGWSPYSAKDFLKGEGLPTRPYHRSYEDEWFSGSDYLEMGDDFGLKNNIAYYLNGTEHAATELKLKLNINVPDAPEDAERRFRGIGLVLLQAAVGQEADTAMTAQLASDGFQIEHDGKRIRLDKDLWQGGIPGGYSRSLTIQCDQ